MNVRGKRKTGRRFLAVVLSICMLFTAQPDLWDGMVQAAEKVESGTDSEIMTADNSGQHADHADWDPLADDTSLTDGKYYLSGNKTMGTITVTGEVTLCLNGHTLTHLGDTGSAVVVESGGKLTLCDCQEHWECESSFDEDAKTYSCFLTGSGGRITGGKGTYIKESLTQEFNSGGGVYVKPNAAFYMNSGRITGCDVGTDEDAWFSRRGGGIHVTGGTFCMTGGFIDANRAELGGGVCLEDGASFTMTGNAVIMDNEGDVNGGVYCYGNDNLVFNMESGKILGNKGSRGGGVFIGSDTLFSMTGGVIEGNTTTEDAYVTAAAGLYCVSSEAKLSGGMIRYNMSSGDAAGGVRVNSSKIPLQVSGGICITDNYCNGTLSNVSINSGANAFITVTGALENDIGVLCKPVSGNVSYPATVVKGTDSYSITEADRQHFSSDIEGYEVLRRETDTGNELYLDVPPHVHDGNTYTALTADNTALSGGTYYLSKDLEMETITTTGDVTLCLNGHTLKHLGDTGSVIVVESGTLTLCDCSGDNRGCITGGKAEEYGGGIYVRKDAHLIMLGGTISGNAAKYGAGISIGGSGESGRAYFMMKGGLIENNTAQSLGGGVWGGANSEITISNGTIKNNSAVNYGGGIYVGATATVILSTDGEPESSAVLITGNTAQSGGGYFGLGTVNVMQTFKIFGNVSITENKADNDHNNIFLQKEKFFKVIGGLTKPVGITPQKAPAVAAPIKIAEGADGHTITDDDRNCIASDNENYEILKKTTDIGNELYLAVPFAISANGAELSPQFDAFTTEYTASVANNVDTVGITATVGEVAADTTTLAMQVNGGTQSTMVSGREKVADLAIGDNTIKITVTGADGVSQTYTLVITRADKQTSPVTVTAYKDGVEWTDCPHTYKLTSDNGSTFITDLTAVPDGTYKIYSGDTDTSVKVTVAGSAATATVEYHTVTFKDGNTEMTQQVVLKGAAASVPAEPTKTGYTFSQWVKADGGSTAHDFTKAVTEKTTVYASWTPNTYPVTLNNHGADGGDLTASRTVTYAGKYGALPVPLKTGYNFQGWYTGADGQGTKIEADTTVTTASAHTLHACWLDQTPPARPVLQDGVTLPAGWTNTQTTIPIKTYDGAGVTELWVSIDGKTYTKADGFSGGAGSVNYEYAVRSGKHTYQFIAKDAAGNTSAASDKFEVGLDQELPVIGTLTYENAVHLNLWHWIIGKTNMVIHVPVTDTGSGADKITYTLTTGGMAEVKTAAVQNGEAEIPFSEDFKGTISITCTDKAGNTSAGVTVGTDAYANGIIVEDNAPEAAFQAKNAELLKPGEYKTTPDIAVTVTDSKDNAVSAGIASVIYQIGSGDEKAVDHNYTAGMVVNDSFTIPADEISAGGIPADGAVISVTATDNAGNSVTKTYTVKVHTHSLKQSVPAKEATCTEGGNIAYVICSCGKYFSDSACTTEITEQDTVTEAKGHDFTGEYIFDKDNHWQECSRCVAASVKEAHQFEADGIHCIKCGFEKAGEGHTHSIDAGGTVPGKAATCTEAGRKAYYPCSCGAWFFDSACTDEITDPSQLEIAALGHDTSGAYESDTEEHWKICIRCNEIQPKEPHIYDDSNDKTCNKCGYERVVGHTHSGTFVAAKPASCTGDGHTAYYQCSCGKRFSDSACTAEVAEQDVVIQAKGHDFSGTYQRDEKHHWKACLRCGETQPKQEHLYDSDTDPDCSVCGWERPAAESGTVSKDVQKDEKAPDTTLSTSKEELADILLTEEEKAQIENGTDIKFILDVKDAGDAVSSSDRAAVQDALSGDTQVKGFATGQYLDISLFKIIGENRSAISQTARKLTVVIDVPDSLKSKDSAKPRTFAIVRVHDGAAEVLKDLDNDADTITIATDRFSAYAIVYKQADSGEDKPDPTPDSSNRPAPTPGGNVTPTEKPDSSDKPEPTMDAGVTPTETPGGEDNETPTKVSGKETTKGKPPFRLKAIQKGKKLQITWDRVSGARGYSIYVQYCGKDFSPRSLNQVKSGKKSNLAQTLTIHIAGKDSVKYTNVKSIKRKKTSYTLKQGGAVTLRPKAVLYDKKKKQLSVNHTKEFRYFSSNKKVAAVTAGGKVKAKGPGSCTVYIFAKNGCRRKIKIRVKK